MSRTRDLWLTVIVGLLCAVPSPAAESPHPLTRDYQDLQEWVFTSSPIDLPEEGLHWRVDTAEWHLDDGQIWLQQPTSAGHVTGAVFRGSGRFKMTVPDPVELRQLRRFAEDPDLEALEGEFDALVMRVVGSPLVAELPVPQGADYTPHPLARDRHDHWLVSRGFDVDARIAAGLGRSQDTYIRIDIKTVKWGWLTYQFDGHRMEEVSVEWFNSDFGTLESWLSLDRREDRRPDGRPSGSRRPIIDIQHVEIAADLTKYAKESPRGMAKIRPMKVGFTTTVRFQALAEGDTSIQFFLSRVAKVERVRDEDGRDLEFLRDHLGKRSSVIDNKAYDRSLVVLMPEPLSTTAVRTLEFRYELEASGYVPGRSWYPSAEDIGSGLLDRHTARLTLTAREEFAIRAMGELEDDALGDGLRTMVWDIDRPVKMMSFVFAKRPYEKSFQFEGLPEVATLSSLGGYLNEERVEQVGADVVNSLNYQQKLLNSRLLGDLLQVGLIPSPHGQAFDGLLHIGDFSVGTDNVAAVELFRAHEVAHEWWGHRVGWNSYRDQWLSEGFAEYSAMMFVEATMDNGPKYYREMVKAYTDELTGSLESSFSQFSRPGITLLNMRALDRIGPIGHGWRCTVGEARSAYQSQIYKKGALVLHMLRSLLQTMTGSDEAFVGILRSFVDKYADTSPTTEDFISVVEEAHPADWSWFFDQWIFGAEIPTYLWSYEIVKAAQGFSLLLHVEQKNVAPGFKMAVPVRVQLSRGQQGSVLAFVDQPIKDFEFPLPQKPRKVIFNPDQAVLARVKKK
jgi:hypothetical protein